MYVYIYVYIQLLLVHCSYCCAQECHVAHELIGPSICMSRHAFTCVTCLILQCIVSHSLCLYVSQFFLCLCSDGTILGESKRSQGQLHARWGGVVPGAVCVCVREREREREREKYGVADAASISHFWLINESCHTDQWVTLINKSCHTHIETWVTLINESCQVTKFMSYSSMSDVTPILRLGSQS